MASIELERLYAHMAWADEQLLTLMNSDRPGMTEHARHLFAHLLSAERVWLLRLRGEDSRVQPVWPDLAIDEMNVLAAVNRAEYARYLDTLTQEDLDVQISYTNQQGRPFQTQVADILIHVALHGSYHRGQIAMAIRSGGGAPVNTDYIAYVRTGGGASKKSAPSDNWEIPIDPTPEDAG